MSKLRAVAGRVRRAVRPRRYYEAPRSYWEQRHSTFGTGLEGVGRLGLNEEGNAAAYEAKWTHLAAALALLGEPGRLLDAGCGIGWFSRRLAAAGHDVTAFDFTEAGIAAARSAGEAPIRWEVADLAGFADTEPYPVVVCIDVLFHVVDDATWEASVRNLARLAAGGHLVVQDHLVEPAETTPIGTPPGAPGTYHTRWRTLADYRELLADAELVSHDHYVVDVEGATKDLLVFAVPTSG